MALRELWPTWRLARPIARAAVACLPGPWIVPTVPCVAERAHPWLRVGAARGQQPGACLAPPTCPTAWSEAAGELIAANDPAIEALHRHHHRACSGPAWWPMPDPSPVDLVPIALARPLDQLT
jgi:hypothetical protein